MANLDNVRVFPIGDELWDVYEVSNHFNTFDYIGQVHADPFIGEVTDVVKGKEKVIQTVANIIRMKENRKMCFRLRFGNQE